MNKVNVGNDLYLKGRIGWRGLSKDEYLDHSSYCIINATSLLDNKINWDNCGYISKERFDESEEIILQEDDILISKDGTLGKIGFVKDKPENATVASGIFVLRNTKQDVLDTTYLYHFLKSNIFKDFIKRNKADGSTINHLYQRDLARLDLDLPSLKEQKNIGYILSTIDEKIETNNKINKELEKLAKTLYDYWFIQFDFPDENKRPYKSSGGAMVYNEILKREIPLGWYVNTIEQNIKKSFSSKKISSNKYQNYGKIPIIDQSPQFICGYTDDIDYLIKYEKKPYIVFGDHSCTLKLVNFDFARGADGTQIIICENENINQYYLYFAIKNIKLSSSYERHYKYLKDSKIIIPNNVNLTNKFEIITDNIYANIRKNIQENNLLISLRDFLLPMLMNGQISIATTE